MVGGHRKQRALTCHSVDGSYSSSSQGVGKRHCVLSSKIASSTEKAVVRLQFENYAHVAWHTSNGIIALALEDELRARTHPRRHVDLQMTSFRACTPSSVSRLFLIDPLRDSPIVKNACSGATAQNACRTYLVRLCR